MKKLCTECNKSVGLKSNLRKMKISLLAVEKCWNWKKMLHKVVKSFYNVHICYLGIKSAYSFFYIQLRFSHRKTVLATMDILISFTFSAEMWKEPVHCLLYVYIMPLTYLLMASKFEIYWKWNPFLSEYCLRFSSFF